MDKSIQFHGAVLRSTYVDCQYSTAWFCDYTVSVTLLKFLLSSRICSSYCCSLVNYNLSKFELRCEQEAATASICRRTATCPLLISASQFRKGSASVVTEGKSHTKLPAELQDIIIWVCSCCNCRKHILMAVCAHISWSQAKGPGNQEICRWTVRQAVGCICHTGLFMRILLFLCLGSLWYSIDFVSVADTLTEHVRHICVSITLSIPPEMLWKVNWE